MITLTQMQYIMKLHQFKSFSKVADYYHVTQPTVSMQVKKAEEIIGFAVFSRKGKTLITTEKGEGVIEHIQYVLKEADELHDFIADSFEESIIELKIGVIPTMALYIVPILLQIKEVNGRDVSIRIHELPTQVLLDQLSTGDIDAAIMAGNSAYDQVIQETFGYEPLVLYMNEESIKGEVVSISQLRNFQPWLLNEVNCLSLQMIQLCQLSDDYSKIYYGGNLQLIVDLVNQEGGFSILPGFALERLDIQEGKEKIIQDSNPFRSLVLAKRKRPKHKAILEGIELVLKSEFNYSEDNSSKEIIEW